MLDFTIGRCYKSTESDNIWCVRDVRPGCIVVSWYWDDDVPDESEYTFTPQEFQQERNLWRYAGEEIAVRVAAVL